MDCADLGPYRLEKGKIMAAFNRAAEHYEDEAVLQRTVAQSMVERLALVKINPVWILDVGAGTGTGARLLAKRYRGARIIQLDIAWHMLRVGKRHAPRFFSRQHFVQGDAEILPIPSRSVDMVYANLLLQWCNNLDQVFGEFRRVLRPSGLLMFTTFGPDTLKELRESWRASDECIHVSAFVDMHDIGDGLIRAGLAEPVMDVEYFTLTYADVYRLMRELKTLGSHNVATGRRHSLTGKGRLKRMINAYEAHRQGNCIPATHEVIYGHAWAPAPGHEPAEAPPGVATFPIAELKRRRTGRPERR